MILGEIQNGFWPLQPGECPACPERVQTLPSYFQRQLPISKATSSDRELTEIDVPTAEIETPLPDPSLKNYSYCVVDDEIYFKENGRLMPVELHAVGEARVKGMVAIRDCVAQLHPVGDRGLSAGADPESAEAAQRAV